jgi:hypothetical protein
MSLANTTEYLGAAEYKARLIATLETARAKLEPREFESVAPWLQRKILAVEEELRELYFDFS